MQSSESSPSKNSRVLIVGAGVFGLSTALHLARDGYTDVTVLDREGVPSQFSAGTDLNKIVRAEYEDPFYTELALEAIREWQTEFWSPYIRLTGYVLATSINSPQKARNSLQKSYSSIKNHPDFPPESFSSIRSGEDVRKHAPMLQGPMEGWNGYMNKHAGYARAAKALEHAAKACLGLGVKFITGDAGYAVELLYAPAIHGKKTVVGVKTRSGSIHEASKTILCLGAHISTLLPNISQQITARAWSVAHIQLTPEEAKFMKGCPVVNCRDIGFFFEPDEDTGRIKFSPFGAGYTNYVPKLGSQEQMSVPTLSNQGIPREDEETIMRLIEETMPQFAGRELIDKFICWCGDRADSDYMIDFVPGTENLLVVAGDSGHAFKMLPIAGRWVLKAIEDGSQVVNRWKWKEDSKGSEDISWRVGKVQDIKDMQISPASRL